MRKKMKAKPKPKRRRYIFWIGVPPSFVRKFKGLKPNEAPQLTLRAASNKEALSKAQEKLRAVERKHGIPTKSLEILLWG